MDTTKRLCFTDDFDSACFSADIRGCRLRAGFTQTNMANMIGLSLLQYGRIERGQARPSLQVFLWLCHVFNLQALWYLEDDAKTPVTKYMFKAYDFRAGKH